MNAMSSPFGSKSPRLAAHWSSVRTSPGRAHPFARELADSAVEALVRLGELEGDARLLDRLVPAVDPALAVDDEVVEEPRVEGAQRRRLLDDERAVQDPGHGVGRVLQHVVVALEVRFIEAALDQEPNASAALEGDLRRRTGRKSPTHGNSSCAAGAAGRRRRAFAPLRRRWDP